MAKVSTDNNKEFSFTDKDFNRVREMIYQRAGISLSDNKQDMVYSRLARRLRVLAFNSFSRYLDTLTSNAHHEEWEAFINALTTNLTSFFREAHHFPVLADFVKHRHGEIQIWCSASSTGEEPYSIAMTVCEAFNSLTPPVKIIATDIDTNVLENAANGIYQLDRVEKMPIAKVKRFFLRGKGANDGTVRVKQALRDLITFQPLNLLAPTWPISGPFDVIFCRNVMIYFDKPTQAKILDRFAQIMKSDGLLFAGHSENFLNVTNRFKLLSKTVYALNHSTHIK
ncbi:CheR family methyltransferase [Sulfuriferula nivalis]|uniref:Chemotaxis protein methyltransferase n=1 Tax=Sulfuriferula nivalis TaxID=2675298 RepID=A0A809S3A3_9PROT|nr:CheR family methyltransferase [Sulfuriferula nivalis]BBP01228.1 chemotaxis protein methyltransferase [Sulfuriferula nivalis]